MRNGAGKKPRAEISTPTLEHIEEHGSLKRLPAPRRKKTGSDAVGDSSKDSLCGIRRPTNMNLLSDTGILRSTVTRSPSESDVIEKEGQPFWLFAAEEHLQCAITVWTSSLLDRQR